MQIKKIFINNELLEVEIADNFFSRFIGLMGRSHLKEGHGLFIVPCNNIHMFFMRFPIDAIYLDKNFYIKKIVRNVRPWIGFSGCFEAWGTLELPSGEAKRLKLSVGQRFICK